MWCIGVPLTPSWRAVEDFVVVDLLVLLPQQFSHFLLLPAELLHHRQKGLGEVLCHLQQGRGRGRREGWLPWLPLVVV